MADSCICGADWPVGLLGWDQCLIGRSAGSSVDGLCRHRFAEDLVCAQPERATTTFTTTNPGAESVLRVDSKAVSGGGRTPYLRTVEARMTEVPALRQRQGGTGNGARISNS